MVPGTINTKGVGDLLDFEADDDLDAAFARVDDCFGTGCFEGGVVDARGVFDFDAQSCDAVIEGLDVVSAAKAFDDSVQVDAFYDFGLSRRSLMCPGGAVF